MKTAPYKSLSDEQLIAAIRSGNEEAAIFLIYNRYYSDLRYLCFNIYNSHDYIDDLCHELYILLKGSNADWAPLASWQGVSSFRTWLNRVARRHFLKNRARLIGFRETKLYSANEGDPDPVERVPSKAISAEDRMARVMLVEAIGRLKNEEQRLVIIKELQGYSHAEIAQMLNQRRLAQNLVKQRKDGTVILVTAEAVDVLKQRAVQNLKMDLLKN